MASTFLNMRLYLKFRSRDMIPNFTYLWIIFGGVGYERGQLHLVWQPTWYKVHSNGSGSGCGFVTNIQNMASNLCSCVHACGWVEQKQHGKGTSMQACSGVEQECVATTRVICLYACILSNVSCCVVLCARTSRRCAAFLLLDTPSSCDVRRPSCRL